MPLELLLYFGILTLIGVGAFVLFIVISIRSDKKESQRRPQQQKTSISGAYRMQVILPDVGKPLIWVANGFAYRHPREMEDSDDISALTEFLAKLQQASPNTPIFLSEKATTAISAPISNVEEGKISAERKEEEERETTPAEKVFSQPTTAALTEQTAKEYSVKEAEKFRSTSVLSYEEQLELPFLERLRTSFFGDSAPTAPKRRRTATLKAIQVPTIPKLEQLEEIVHQQLANIPDAPLINIGTADDGLLKIVVNHQSYERIDDIPEETIRQIMHKSVKIWENKI